MVEARRLLAEPAPAGFPLGLHAFCKLNLGLAVGPRRPDGFHEVATVFQTIDLADTLYARPRARGLRLRVVRRGPARGRGLAVGAGGSNLVARAARRLRAAAGERGGAEIVLVKRVPAGSGLGGGSSDAAAALRLLARLWGAPVRTEGLRRLAGGLGSDCAFFVAGGRARATGRGERLSRLQVPGPRRVLVALPATGVPTARAYRLLDEARGAAARSKDLTPSARARKISPRWTHPTMSLGARSLLRNDFEEVIASHYPGIRAATSLLCELGVGSPRLSGSGSAVFLEVPPGMTAPGAVTRQRQRSLALVLARFTRVGSLWCR